MKGYALLDDNEKLSTAILSDYTIWTDYSSTSTVVGWSSFTAKIISYSVIGKVAFLSFALSGTSNATSASFTIPAAITPSSTHMWTAGHDIGLRVADNGTGMAGWMRITGGSLTINLSNSMTSLTGWTDSGNKSVEGTVCFPID